MVSNCRLDFDQKYSINRKSGSLILIAYRVDHIVSKSFSLNVSSIIIFELLLSYLRLLSVV